MKKRYLITAVVAVLLVAGAVAFANPAVFKGFIALRDGKGASSSSSGSSSGSSSQTKYQDDEGKWWCISSEELEAKWQAEWHDQVNGENGADPNGGSGSGSGSNGGSTTSSGGSEIKNDGGSKFTDATMGKSSPPSDWIKVVADRALQGGDGSVTIPGGRSGGGILEGGGSIEPPKTGTPDVPDKPGDSDVETGGSTGDVEGKTAYYYVECGCSDKSVYVKELKKKFNCPDYNSAYYESHEGYYVLNIYKPAEYECKREWECPQGSENDWNNIYDECQSAKQDQCRTGGKNTSAGVAKACNIFVPYIMGMECVSKADCDKSKELYKESDMYGSGNGGGIDYTAEILQAGLPYAWECEQMFGGDYWYGKE